MWLRLSGKCALIILIWLYRLHEKLSTGTMSIMETLFQSLVSQGHLKTAYQVLGGDRGWHILSRYHLLNQMSAGLTSAGKAIFPTSKVAHPKRLKIRPIVVHQEVLNILCYDYSKKSLVYRVFYIYSLPSVNSLSLHDHPGR